MENRPLIEEINDLRKEKNAVILAHYYQDENIQNIADFVGDSLELSKKALTSEADIIVFSGVHFMAETAKILNPDKRVFIPDLNAGCSLSDGCDAEDLLALKQALPDHKVVSYINCSAAVKAISDIVCTSSNAVQIVNSFPKDQPIIFAPDKNLGKYIQTQLGRELTLWDGSCIVHEAFSLQKLIALKLNNPEALIIAHPESESAILDYANFVGSTSQMIQFVKKSTADCFIVATEAGILHKMKEDVKGVKIIPAPGKMDNSCSCSECAFMKVNTLEKIKDCLNDESPEIELDSTLAAQARIPIDRMLNFSL